MDEPAPTHVYPINLRYCQSRSNPEFDQDVTDDSVNVRPKRRSLQTFAVAPASSGGTKQCGRSGNTVPDKVVDPSDVIALCSMS
jgi:hypothetical protein